MGRSNSRIRPETKLLTMLCKPKPMPTPNAPARTVILVISTPRKPIANTKPTARIVLLVPSLNEPIVSPSVPSKARPLPCGTRKTVVPSFGRPGLT